MPDQLPVLPPRAADGHKGTFGTVCVISGQAAPPLVMIGGPSLCAIGALRVGAGLAILAVPAPIMDAAITIAPSATGVALPVDDDGQLLPSAAAEILDTHLRGCHCVAIGPGLGTGEAQQQVVIRLVSQQEFPLVIDADALNVLAATAGFDRDLLASSILTPHPGEFERLSEALELGVDGKDPNQRGPAAEALARRLGCVVVLKGAGTVVTDGVSTSVNTTGNAALATGGSGDVLTGVLAGLVAQFHRPPTPELTLLECARIGVHLHGLVADQWVAQHGEAGLLAEDILDGLPEALKTLRP